MVFLWFAFWIVFFFWVCSLEAQVVRVSNRNSSLTVNAGAAQTVTLPDAAQLNGTVTPKPSTLRTTIAWSKTAGPGTVTFASPNAAATSAQFSIDGTYILTLSASTSKLSAKSNVTVTVNPAPIVPTVSVNNLAWDTVAGADGYNLYRTDGACDDLATFQKANSQLITAIPYGDPPGTAAAWCYFVRAVNASGESAASNVIWVPTKQ